MTDTLIERMLTEKYSPEACTNDPGAVMYNTAIDRGIAILSEPVSEAEVERVAEELILELKRQNLSQDKDIGRTKYRLLAGVDGISDVKALAKAAIAAYRGRV